MAKRRAAHNVRTEGFRPVSNEAFNAAMQEKGRSSAAQRHTLKKFKGTRASQTRAAMAG